MKRSLVSLQDVSQGEIAQILALAKELKAKEKSYDTTLKGKTLRVKSPATTPK